MKPAQPVKSAMFKVTIDSNKPPVNLNDLFTGKHMLYITYCTSINILSIALVHCLCTIYNYLFTELLGMNAGGQGAAIGFEFYGGPVITLLASKTSRKFNLLIVG